MPWASKCLTLLLAAAGRLARPILLARILLLLPLPWTLFPAEAARDIGAQRECATCHIMWLRDFKRRDVSTLVPYDPKPVTDTGKQDVASTERMCFSCHDGFVLDSRSVWKEGGHGHPVGVRPSAKVKIPTSAGKVIFPLNDNGKVYCGTCHTAHGVEWNQKESPVFLRVKNVDSSLCLACHLDRSTGPAEGNHPVFEFLDKFPSSLFRAGAKFGSDGSVICESCHRVHGAPEKKILVMDNKGSRLCATCHADKRSILKSKHDISIMAPDSKNIKGETASESGPCGACHVPHGGQGPALWARQAMHKADPTAASCLGCHNDKGIAKDKTVGDPTHPVNVDVDRLGIVVGAKGWASHSPLLDKDHPLKPLPLYDRHGLHTHGRGRVGCGSCHDPHRWSPEGSQESGQDPREVEGDASNSFLRMADKDGGGLCTNCHVNKRPLAFSKHNMKLLTTAQSDKTGDKGARQKNTGKKSAEKKSTEGLCTACHTPHNAKGPALWARDQGEGKGVIEKMCTGCHQKGGVAGEKQVGATSHPVGVNLTRSMRTDLPLYSQGGKVHSGDGKLDCATCHDPHQWDPSDPASRAGADAKSEGDAHTSFLRFSAAGSSRLCGECHWQQALVVDSDHDLRITAPNTKNLNDQSPKESGVCGQCHVAHGAGNRFKLWARAEGNGDHPIERYCRSCHAAGGAAKEKAPAEAHHPENVKVWSAAVRTRFRNTSGKEMPVYDEHGKRDSRGRITCTTCHEPHRWSAAKPAKGPGKNTEGDVRNSFLRVSNSEHFVCADCHGLDALFRYKYFHSESAHKKYPLYTK